MNHLNLRLPSSPLSGIKMVFFDLDGTVLNSKKELTQETIQAFRDLKESGIPYTFASARVASMMGICCHQAKISGPFIALEGAEIRIWETGNTLCHFPIDQEDGQELMDLCHHLHFDYSFYTSQAAFFRQDTNRMTRFRNYNERALAMGLLPVSCQFYEAYGPQYILQQKLLKVFVASPNEAERAALTEFIRAHPALRMDSSEGTSVSIVANSVSKAASIELLCKMQGIQPTEICCFGDYYNDMAMLRMAGFSVAMGNAPEEVKNAAQYVTIDNDDNGVAYFIRNYLCPQ